MRPTSRRWNDDHDIPRGAGIIDCERVIDRIGREARHVILNAIDEINTHPRVVGTCVNQSRSNGHSRSINTEMKLLSATPAATFILGGSPFAFANERQPRAADDEILLFYSFTNAAG